MLAVDGAVLRARADLDRLCDLERRLVDHGYRAVRGIRDVDLLQLRVRHGRAGARADGQSRDHRVAPRIDHGDRVAVEVGDVHPAEREVGAERSWIVAYGDHDDGIRARGVPHEKDSRCRGPHDIDTVMRGFDDEAPGVEAQRGRRRHRQRLDVDRIAGAVAEVRDVDHAEHRVDRNSLGVVAERQRLLDRG